MKKRYSFYILLAIILIGFYSEYTLREQSENFEITEAKEFHKKNSRNPASTLESNNALPVKISRPPLQMSNETPNETACELAFSQDVDFEKFLLKNKVHLSEVVGLWFNSKSITEPQAQETTTSGKFFLALARADLLDGKKIHPNLNESFGLINEVINEDPTNSAPLLFAAVIAEKFRRFDEARKYIEQLQTTTHYNSYVSDHYHQIFASVESLKDFMSAAQIQSSSPIPAMSDALKLLKKYRLKNVAEQLVQPVIDNRSAIMEFDWLPVEYSMGVAAMKSIDPSIQYPRWMVLYKDKNRISSLPLSEYMQDISDISKCNSDEIEIRYKQDLEAIRRSKL